MLLRPSMPPPPPPEEDVVAAATAAAAAAAAPCAATCRKLSLTKYLALMTSLLAPLASSSFLEPWQEGR